MLEMNSGVHGGGGFPCSQIVENVSCSAQMMLKLLLRRPKNTLKYLIVSQTLAKEPVWGRDTCLSVLGSHNAHLSAYLVVKMHTKVPPWEQKRA